MYTCQSIYVCVHQESETLTEKSVGFPPTSSQLDYDPIPRQHDTVACSPPLTPSLGFSFN